MDVCVFVVGCVTTKTLNKTPYSPPPTTNQPTGLLNTASLNDTYLSLFMDSLIAPFPLIYERDVVRKGIRLKRFVFHPDSLSQRRPDAEVFSPVDEDVRFHARVTVVYCGVCGLAGCLDGWRIGCWLMHI